MDQVAASIRAVTEETAKVKALVDEVHLSSQEQSRGIEQIGKAIAQMEQVTQRTAASAEESAAASKELIAQADTVRTVVDQLLAMVGGQQQQVAATIRKNSLTPPPLTASLRKDSFDLD